jgi:phospholipid/cholesterol/gamma-HCH transport system ATP-binding protein
MSQEDVSVSHDQPVDYRRMLAGGNGAAAVTMKEVSKRLGRKQVLDAISLEVRKGEIFCIMGGSGAGKSVTLKNMIGLMRPEQGQILVDGVDVTRLTHRQADDVRRKMGYVFQYSALLNSLTVFDNVALPLREHDRISEAEIRRRVEEVLLLVRLERDDFEKLPGELSGGMRKRAGLARAIVRKPDIILYDEPTSGLDPVTTAKVNEMILDMKRKLGVTSIVVTHDVASMRLIADRAAFLFKGKIHFLGTPADFDGSEDPIVRQFIRGEAHGPITDEENARN